jgi:DNA-binding MarR family transcriptional regulator
MTEHDRNRSLIETLDSLIVRFDGQGRQKRDGTVRHTGKLVGLDMTFSTLLILDRMGDSGITRITDLAQSAGVTSATVSRQIQDLERRELVKRTRDESDGRASIVVLTAQGHKVAEIARQARIDILEQALSDWGDDEMRQLIALFERLQANLREFWAAPPRTSADEADEADEADDR